MTAPGEEALTAKQGFAEETTGREDIAAERGLAISAPKDVHVIPQSHIDLIWYWSRAEAVRMVLHTFRGHAELLERNPTYTYAQSQAAAYQMVLEEDPELFERIKRLVRKGQWELVGGEWVEPDTVLPGPEGRVRQFLVGQRFFQTHFGRRAVVGWCPDGFILHPGSLPQLLRQAGLRLFVHKRPREKMGHLPLLPYRWRGFDGSEVLAFRSNNKGNGLPTVSEGTVAPDNKSDLAVMAEAFEGAGLNDMWGPMGVGDIGGVNSYALPRTGDMIRPRYSTPSRFLQALEDGDAVSRLETVNGSLPPIFTGALTTWAVVKQLNRAAETALTGIEFLKVLAEKLEVSTAHTEIDHLWKTVLFYQFHDAIAGCGTEVIKDRVVHEYRHVVNEAETIRNRLLRRLAEAAVMNWDDAIPVAVFNRLGHVHDGTVECRVTLPGEFLDLVPFGREDTESCAVDCRDFRNEQVELIAVDEAGKPSPVMIKTYAQVQKKFTATVRFQAADLPPFGARIFYLKKRPAVAAQVRITGTDCVDNGAVGACFDREQGGITQLKFAPAGLHFDAPGGGIGQLRIHHTGDYAVHYGKELRAWTTGFTGEQEVLKPCGCRLAAYSGHRQAVIFDYRYENSVFQQECLFAPGADCVDVSFHGDWQEVEKYLKVHFAFNHSGEAVAFADLSYGFTSRLPRDVEYPMQYFCGIRDDAHALMIANDGCHGCRHEPDGSVSVSLIRCATYPARISDSGPFNAGCRIMGVSINENWVEGMFRRAYEYNNMPLAYAPEYSSQQNSLSGMTPISIDAEHVLIPLLKPADDGDGWVARLFNPNPAPVDTPLRVTASSWHEANILEDPVNGHQNPKKLTFRPFELKTLRIHAAT